MREYRKAQLVLKLLFKHFGDFTLKDYELFMEKADVLEASIYERLIVEAARDGIRRDPALFQGETFREMKKHLSNLPIFSASYK